MAVIPARGGSKGIPRKNLRPLAGKPLIWYAIKACAGAKSIDRVVVSTDDDEIALFAERFGAAVVRRPPELAGDEVTLDPVIVHAVRECERASRERYDVVLTVQPTCPLVQSADLNAAVQRFSDQGIDTVLSVMDDRHLLWTLRGGVPVPAYSQRVNRQQLPPSFRETGAIIGCRRNQLDRGTRIGERVALHEMPRDRSLDIDTPVDFHLCESILVRKRVVFVVAGNAQLGLGHAYRSITLAHELIRHAVTFVCPADSDLAIDYIRRHNYPVETSKPGELLGTVLSNQPDLVINDILDTDETYVAALKSSGAKVINFEDLGSGCRHADLVINALYPHPSALDNMLVGPDYFCLRDEFLHLPVVEKTDRVRRVLVTFGGVDEGNLTARVLQVLVPLCRARDVAVDVVTGPGYAHHDALREAVKRLGYERLIVVSSTQRISDFMCRADLAITSGGRTVLELAALRVPTVVICQNRREMTHVFASAENGILNLGYRGEVSDDRIASALVNVLDDPAVLDAMRAHLERCDFTQGKRRVIERIEALLRWPA